MKLNRFTFTNPLALVVYSLMTIATVVISSVFSIILLPVTLTRDLATEEINKAVAHSQKGGNA